MSITIYILIDKIERKCDNEMLFYYIYMKDKVEALKLIVIQKITEDKKVIEEIDGVKTEVLKQVEKEVTAWDLVVDYARREMTKDAEQLSNFVVTLRAIEKGDEVTQERWEEFVKPMLNFKYEAKSKQPIYDEVEIDGKKQLFVKGYEEVQLSTPSLEEVEKIYDLKEILKTTK